MAKRQHRIELREASARAVVRARAAAGAILTLIVIVLAGIGWWWTATAPPAARVRADLDRHAARRSAADLRLYRRPDAGPDALRRASRSSSIAPTRTRRRRCRRTRRCSPDSLPFEHRVRDNLGFTLAAGQSTIASLFASAGYRDGRVRVRVRAAAGYGHRHRDSRCSTQRFQPRAGDQAPAQIFASGSRHTRGHDDVAEDARRRQVFSLLPHLRAARALRAAFAVHAAGQIRRRGRVLRTRSSAQLFAWLRERGWYDDATIVVTADHGEGLGDHGERAWTVRLSRRRFTCR